MQYQTENPYQYPPTAIPAAQIGRYEEQPPTEYYMPPQTNRIATPAMAIAAFDTGFMESLRILRNPVAQETAHFGRTTNPALLYRRASADLVERAISGTAVAADFSRATALGALGLKLGGLVGGIPGAGLGFVAGFAADEIGRRVTDATGITSISDFFEERNFIQGLSKGLVRGVNSNDFSMSGFTERESGEVTRFLKRFYKDSDKKFTDINEELTGFVQQGLISDVRSVDDFKQQWTQLKDNIKKITEVFQKTQDEAIELISDFQRRGIGSDQVVRLTEMTNRFALLSGQTSEQLTGTGLRIAEAFQGTGLSPQAGYSLGTLTDFSIRSAVSSGKITGDTIWQLGGEERATQIISQMAIEAFNDPRGDALLRSAMRNDGTVDMNRVLQTVSGQRNVFQNANDAFGNMTRNNNFLRYAAEKENMISSILEKQPGIGSALILQGMLDDAEQLSFPINDYQELAGFARKVKGIDRNTFDTLVGSVLEMDNSLTLNATEQELQRRNAMELARIREDERSWKKWDDVGLGSFSGAMLNLVTLGGYGASKYVYRKTLKKPIGEAFDSAYEGTTSAAEDVQETFTRAMDMYRYGSFEADLTAEAVDMLYGLEGDNFDRALQTRASDAGYGSRTLYNGFGLFPFAPENTATNQVRERLRSGDLPDGYVRTFDEYLKELRDAGIDTGMFYSSGRTGEGRILRRNIAEAVGGGYLLVDDSIVNLGGVRGDISRQNQIRISAKSAKPEDLLKNSDPEMVEEFRSAMRSKGFYELPEKSASEQFDFFLNMPEVKQRIAASETDSDRQRIAMSIMNAYYDETGSRINTGDLTVEDFGQTDVGQQLRQLEELAGMQENFVETLGENLFEGYFGRAALGNIFGGSQFSSATARVLEGKGAQTLISSIAQLKSIDEAQTPERLRELYKKYIPGTTDADLEGRSADSLRSTLFRSVRMNATDKLTDMGAAPDEVVDIFLQENIEKIPADDMEKLIRGNQAFTLRSLAASSRKIYEDITRQKMGEDAAEDLSQLGDNQVIAFLRDNRDKLFAEFDQDSIKGVSDQEFIKALQSISKTGKTYLSGATTDQPIQEQNVANQQTVAALKNIVVILEALMRKNQMKTVGSG